MKRAVLFAALLLAGCADDADRKRECVAAPTFELVRFPDGSEKECRRVSCSDGCLEVVCKDVGPGESCRPLNTTN